MGLLGYMVHTLALKFYVGVPDSCIATLCAELDGPALADGTHVIAANEGAAVAMAIGHHLATGEVPG